MEILILNMCGVEFTRGVAFKHSPYWGRIDIRGVMYTSTILD